MAIVKMLSVKSAEGLRRAMDYVKDPDKTIQRDIWESPGKLTNNELSKVLKYAANEKKTNKIYVSGYLCDPDLAEEQFLNTREEDLNRVKKIVDINGDVIAYHIIQSFPENIDISDEEVHQCGRELCEKLGLYEAVICSHLHPELKEDGLLHGKCKHNHIIMNAYCKDPEKQFGKDTRKIKYHDCTESLNIIRKYNDEISIVHGLPIIINPDNEKNNSWTETTQAKSGTSWKENIRRDIDNMRRVCHTWNDYINGMKAAGYAVKENKYITYTTPDGEHKVRDKTLGREYTKETLERYWTAEKNIKDTSEIIFEELQELTDEAAKNGSDLYVKIMVNNETPNKNRYSFNVSLNKKIHRQEAYNSYFDVNKSYRIFDENNKKIMTVSGKTLRLYFENMNEKECKPDRDYTIKGRYFYNNTWTDKKNKRPYRVGLYGSDGHRRGLIELVLLLAIQILSDKSTAEYTSNKQRAYIRTDWKLQNMINSVVYAREKNIRTDAELTEKMNITGKTCSRLKTKIRKNNSVYNKYETLNKTLDEFLSVKSFCEGMKDTAISDMPPEIQQEYAEKIQIYKRTKAVLYKYEMITDKAITDFKTRFKQCSEQKKQMDKEYKTAAHDYSELKKLQRQFDTAKDNKYVYERNGRDKEYTQATRG